jgi:photosystem II stability/assembly factor-like uncharacterized protein
MKTLRMPFQRVGALLTFKLLLLSFFFSTHSFADDDKPLMSSDTFKGLEFRNIGSAFKSGRISDVEIDPNNTNVWYVGVGSGGVWKTVNAGTTWVPVFDGQKVYAIGTITIDPSNSNTVWVGTGENVGGRHISFGDGVYRSQDGGKTWENMGLKKTEHISEIIVHPENPNTVWVAAQGPLWNKGDERGLYKTIDGGKSWKKVLGDAEWTGVTDIVMDPREPNRLYAATWQKHRTVAAYYGSGPNSGIHRSEDGGETWTRLKTGLPKVEMGKIGLAISPQKPDVVYAAIELERRTGAVYRSDNRGASWVKGAPATAGGTGPHYYQELYASPHHFDRIYLAGVRMQISLDGGKTFSTMKEEHKHSDNHSLTFLTNNENYLLMGSDGGIYESFDDGENWRFISNLPLTQYYKVAVDDALPFYNVYGGTQDNNTQGGPSRTDSGHGIMNSDWEVVLFADGHQPATEPGNPDIVYAEWQQGNLTRLDRTTGEVVYIQPQPEAGEPSERFNWDAPILVSPHKPTRLYFASHRVWRSEDRGDSWTAISGDLTKNLERIEQPIMGSTQSWDGSWDLLAMSQYSTITSLAESPVKEGLIYAGTDDGSIQMTENGGQSWRRIDVTKLPKVSNTAFINDIKADLFDENTVYVSLDNHKFGDFTPYLYKSTNKGRTWKSIGDTLPDNHLVFRLVQDHVNAKLLFAATEFGVFFSVSGGNQWIEMNGGMPTVGIRDLAIQRRENDLVAASFGRGFFILDDYSALRSVSEKALSEEAVLFPTRKALWYIERFSLGFSEKGSAGASHYAADNPPFGAVFTYYLKDGLKTLKDVRQAKEKALKKDNKAVSFPGWDAVEAEASQKSPSIWLTVRDNAGNTIRRIKGESKKGFHRTAWDLRYPSPNAVSSVGGEASGSLVAPGTYSVSLSKEVDGVVTELQSPQTFVVEQLRKGTLAGSTPEQAVAFWQELADAQRVASALGQVLSQTTARLPLFEEAINRSQAAPGSLDTDYEAIRDALDKLDRQLNGLKAKRAVGEDTAPSINSRLSVVGIGTGRSTYGATPTLKRSLQIAQEEIGTFRAELDALINQTIPAFEAKLEKAGAPWVSGQALPKL